MNPTNTAKLKKSFPKILSKCSNIWTDDGWYDVVYQMLKEISEVSESIRILQIKEKHSCLTAYIDNEIFLKAEEEERVNNILYRCLCLSLNVCEYSGAAGASLYVNEDGVCKTLCPMSAALLGFKIDVCK